MFTSESDGTYSSSLAQRAESSSAETENTHDRISPTHDTYNSTVNSEDSQHTVATTHSSNVQSVQNSDQSVFSNPVVQDYGVPVLPRQNTIHNASRENYQQYGAQYVPAQQTEHNHDDHNIPNDAVPGRAETRQYNHGNTEDLGTQSMPFKKPLSYGEHVIQQARSLQNYGRNVFKTHVGNKRPNSDDVSLTSNKLTGTQNVGKGEEEQLFLPPPPKQTKTSVPGSSKSQRYGVTKVPSAQATFPADFDARIKRDPVQTDNVGIKPNLEEEPKDLESDEHQTKLAISLEKNVEKTMQEKVEENLKNKNIVIKDFSKKGTIPRFIPRQAQVKTKSDKIQQNDSKSSDIMNRANKLNLEIKKNAFKLGRAQGPADLGPSTSNESLDPKDKSVMDSILLIRKRLTNVSPSFI